MLQIVTTLLDLLGLLLLVAAAAVWVWCVAHPALGLAVGGVGLLAGSWLIDAARRPRRGREGA